MVANSGRFKNALPTLLGDQPFNQFMGFSHWLFETTNQTHKIALKRLFELVYEYMITVLDIPESVAASVLISDYSRSGQKGLAGFMQHRIQDEQTQGREKSKAAAKRQARHAC